MSGFDIMSAGQPYLRAPRCPGEAGVVSHGTRDRSMGLGGVSSAAPCGLGPRDQPGDTPGRELAAESLQSSNPRPQSASPRSSGVTGLQRGVPSPTWTGGSLPTPRWPWGRGHSVFQEGRPGCLLLDSDVRGGPDPWSRRAATLPERTLLAQEHHQIHPEAHNSCPASHSAWTPPSSPFCAQIIWHIHLHPGPSRGEERYTSPQDEAGSADGARSCVQ